MTFGTVIIDGESGTVVKDINIVENIVFTYLILADISSESIAEEIRSIAEMKTTQSELDGLSEVFSTLIPYLRSEDVAKVRNLEKTIGQLGKSFSSFINVWEDSINVEKDVLSGNKSFENADKLFKLTNQTITQSEDLKSAFIDVTNDMNVFYDIFIDNANYYRVNKNEMMKAKNDFNIEMDAVMNEFDVIMIEAKKTIEDVEKNVLWGVESSEERTTSSTINLPGSILLIAVSVLLVVFILLAVGLLIKKRKG